MLEIILVIFLVLHGLVHLLYFAQSARFFELNSGMTWPEESWSFSLLLKKKVVRNLACNLCILAAISFVVSGIALAASHTGYRYLVSFSAVFSSFIFILFWNGKWEKIHDQGGIAILINLAILIISG